MDNKEASCRVCGNEIKIWEDLCQECIDYEKLADEQRKREKRRKAFDWPA